MASFIDACRFTPTLGGTADWTYSAAVTGYQSPSLAGAVNGLPYRYRAESADLSQWEIGVGVYNSGTVVIPRTTVLYNSSGSGTASGQSGAGSKISFSAVPQVAVVALAEDLANLGTANAFTGGDLTLSAGSFKNTQQSLTEAHLDTSGAATYLVATGASNMQVLAAGGLHFVAVAETTVSGQSALYLAGGGLTPILVAAASGSIFVAPNAVPPTPSSGQSTLGYDGSVYRVYHNQAQARSYRVGDWKF